LPGQYLDEETGFAYNVMRDYDQSAGRYLQPDPIGLMGGVNLYGYANGNSIWKADPFGLISLCEAMIELLATSEENPLLNGTPFSLDLIPQETILAGGHGPSGAHFTDARNNLDYDIQYVQVGWSVTQTHGPGIADTAVPMMGLGALFSGDLSYFEGSDLAANTWGSSLGSFGALNCKSFADFVENLCPEDCAE
jgi:RHS repeat-associated protein